MTQLIYSDLALALPSDSVEYVGANQLKLNLTQVQGEEITPDSSIVEGIAKLLDGLTSLTNTINQERLDDELDTIQYVSKHLVGSPDKPMYEYKVLIKINPESFIENLVDPSVSA
jgi:hypothetical protein